MKNIIIFIIVIILIVLAAIFYLNPFNEEVVFDEEAIEKEKAECEARGGVVKPCIAEPGQESGEECAFKCLIETWPTLEDYPISEKFEGAPAPVDYSSHPSTETFYTKITEGAKQEPNFAGHYVIIEWGCGTSCQTGVVFDTKTGFVYNLPLSELEKKYQVNSALLIVNPDLEEIAQKYPGLIFEGISTRYYKWENNTFELIEERVFE